VDLAFTNHDVSDSGLGSTEELQRPGPASPLYLFLFQDSDQLSKATPGGRSFTFKAHFAWPDLRADCGMAGAAAPNRLPHTSITLAPVGAAAFRPALWKLAKLTPREHEIWRSSKGNLVKEQNTPDQQRPCTVTLKTS
jgi:hypothetical protein